MGDGSDRSERAGGSLDRASGGQGQKRCPAACANAAAGCGNPHLRREDPPISKDALSMLNIMDGKTYEEIVELTRKISSIIKDELAKKSLTLYDIKLEFGHLKDGRLSLIDEISGGNMRAYKDGKYVSPLDVEKIMLS